MFFHKIDKLDSVFNRAARAVREKQGQVSLKKLAGDVGLSLRQLERKFHEKSGISPKRLCRILRFRHLFEHITSHPDDQWVDAALAEPETLLEHCNRNFDVLDSRGLAFCGMALLEKSDEYIQDAMVAFKTAREICSAVGVVKRVARMFGELKKVDEQGVLGNVRVEEGRG